MAFGGVRNRLIGLFAAIALAPASGLALDRVVFQVSGGSDDLRAALKTASLLAQAKADGLTDPGDLVGAALADYGRILDALYAQGYYGGVIHILIDGREAAGIGVFSVPDQIGTVTVSVEPGPRFRFSTATITPLPAGAMPPVGFRTGRLAPSTVIREAADQGISDWREAGHAKAAVASQSFTADHRDATLDARITLAPGPVVYFGDLELKTPSAVRAERIARIAGLPAGQVYSPEMLETVAKRLQRTGAFSSVRLSEADTLGPGDTLDIGLETVDRKPRRFGFGAEVSSLDGLTLSGFWLHRNLLGGAERLRFDAEVAGITSSGDGIDVSVSGRLDIPAAFATDIDGFVTAEASWLQEPAYEVKQGGFSAGAHKWFSDRLEGEVALAYEYSITTDSLGERRFRLLSLPVDLTWDRRDDSLNPTGGTFLEAEVEPFHDFSGGATGARTRVDGRYYAGLGDRLVLAGRAQVGAVIGAGAAEVPPDMLFFSGGGGTVRGFPYQSMGADGGDTIGGRAFLGVSAEARFSVTGKIGLVAFADTAHVGTEAFFDTGYWQTGAGLGLRYDTGLGPIRLDVAAPVSGPGGAGVQVYIGIGQAF